MLVLKPKLIAFYILVIVIFALMTNKLTIQTEPAEAKKSITTTESTDP